MKEKVKCPRCKSLQSFGLQKRESGDNEEIFIRCTTCRWEKILIVDTPDRIHNRKQIEKLKLRAKNDPALYKILNRKIEKLNE